MCEKKDPANAASIVLKAMQAENETLQKELLCRQLEVSTEVSSTGDMSYSKTATAGGWA